jgi:hypothetical protein
MIENLPPYVSVTFIITTFLTVGFFLYGVRRTVFDTVPAKIFSFLLAFWMLFQAVFALGGFYQKTDTAPPRIVLFGVFPAILTILLFFVAARRSFIEQLPLKTLTLLHVIRIPVELVLYWLFEHGLVPRLMTFEGRNFDILSGLTAPVVCWLAFRGGRVNRPLLIVWNLLALGLLVNIVAHAVLSFPFPLQQMAFDQPNRAIVYFPYVWLPTIVVPVVLFSHLIALWQLFKSNK